MRHRKTGRRLGRNSSHRTAMYRNMVTSLMLHGRIRTTEAKAKELRRIADKVITLGKRVQPAAMEAAQGEEQQKLRAQRLHNIRRSRVLVNNQDALHKVFNEYAERFKDRPGGYTRIYKLGFRQGDNAAMALIELVDAMGNATGDATDAVEVDEEETEVSASEGSEGEGEPAGA